MAGPWEKYGTPEVVSEGGPWAKYGPQGREWTPREAVDALPDFLTRTPFEKQNDHLRNHNARQEELERLGLEGARGESAAIGAYDGLSLGNYAAERSAKAMYPTYAGMPFMAQGAAALDKAGVLPDWAGGGQVEAQEAAMKGFQEQQTAAAEEHPMSYMGGEIAGYLAPGGGVLNTGSKVARAAGSKIFNPGMVMRGSGSVAKGVRYMQGAVAPAAIAGGVDMGIYEATVGESRRAAEEGRTATLGDRADGFRSGATNPWGYIAGGVASPIYRAGRYAATGQFTPTPRAQWAAQIQQTGTPQSKAYRMVAKRLKEDGITTEQLNQAIDNYYYAGYSTVDEMLFELAEAATNDKGGGKVKQLAVALGSVGGDAQQTARANFDARKAEMPGRIREELRKAVGLEGSDFYDYRAQIENQRRTLPKPLYDDAYANSIQDADWAEKVWPGLQTKPASQDAIVEAYDYARNLGELEVAGEIAELLPGIGRTLDERTGAVVRIGKEASAGARQAVPAKPSTQALDYIDRMLGDTAESLRSSATKRTELAKGPAGAQASLRSVLDPATDLNVARDKSAELIAAENALEFGRKGFANGMDLETLRGEFARQTGKYGGEHIDPALLMGWIRGAEDAIEKSTNPGTVMRQIYGSERQRAKLLEMLPDGAQLGSGSKADATKRRNVLVGRKKGDMEIAGRFDRSRRMLASENEIVGNSQTGQRNEAVQAQGGLQRLANTVADAVLEPRQSANKLIRAGVNRVARPGIFNPKVNRELGEIMFTPGRENLQRIVRELDAVNRPPPMPGGPSAPAAPAAAAPQSGPAPTPAAAVAQAGFINPEVIQAPGHAISSVMRKAQRAWAGPRDPRRMVEHLDGAVNQQPNKSFTVGRDKDVDVEMSLSPDGNSLRVDFSVNGGHRRAPGAPVAPMAERREILERVGSEVQQYVDTYQPADIWMSANSKGKGRLYARMVEENPPAGYDVQKSKSGAIHLKRREDAPQRALFDRLNDPRGIAETVAQGTSDTAPGRIHAVDGVFGKSARARNQAPAMNAERRVHQYLANAEADDVARANAATRQTAQDGAQQRIMAQYRKELRSIAERHSDPMETRARLTRLVRTMPGMSRRNSTADVKRMVDRHMAQIERGSVRAYPPSKFTWKAAPDVPPPAANQTNAQILKQEQVRAANSPHGSRMNPNEADELTDILFNPDRADEAYMMMTYGRRFDDFDRTGQAAAAVLGGTTGTAIISQATQPRSQDVDPAAIAEAETQRLLESYVPSTKADVIPIQAALVREGMVQVPKHIKDRGPEAEAQYLRDWIDGGWGPQTSNALRAFQNRKGLPATGKMTPATAEALGLNAQD